MTQAGAQGQVTRVRRPGSAEDYFLGNNPDGLNFREFIGEAPLIIHNGVFDMGFLNAELQRIHIGKLVNEAAALEQTNEILWVERDDLPALLAAVQRNPGRSGEPRPQR